VNPHLTLAQQLEIEMNDLQTAADTAIDFSWLDVFLPSGDMTPPAQ
jgi:hypothetical protein